MLYFTAGVQYNEGCRPPFKTETFKPVKMKAKPDRSSTHPGRAAQDQGTVDDENGQGIDGVEVRVELLGPLDVVVWQGTAATVSGHHTVYVQVPDSTADGTHALVMTAGDLGATVPFMVDSTIPRPS